MGTDRVNAFHGPDSVRHEAAELLLLAARTLVSPQTPLWGRARCIDLIDTLLDLATRHGFMLTEPLLEMLDADLYGDDTLRMLHAAFNPVPETELVAALQQSSFHAWLQGKVH
ncbi:hypothetical protein DPV79_21380 [Burkholderia reimsis]|uniref:Uncharacterized protein n=1 Tax=Burkholderia reimsis TaxID=2234132 RepID=A0A365QSC1_9BURK|nr:hypothetical protein [Burkholderia reimsis]RBB37550.1 hypothetical protein DPV79_21380 [Burkholderia reimsis]